MHAENLEMNCPASDASPESLGSITREYMKALPVKLARGAAGLQSARVEILARQRRETNYERGLHPKRRFCLISSATAGGT